MLRGEASLKQTIESLRVERESLSALVRPPNHVELTFTLRRR